MERFERFCLSEDIQAGEVLVGNCMRSCVSDLFPRGSNVHAGRGHSRGDAGAAVLAVICFWVQLYSLQRGDVFGAVVVGSGGAVYTILYVREPLVLSPG